MVDCAQQTLLWHRQMTWPHEVTYTPSGQPDMYDQLNTVDFVNGYLTVMAREIEIKARMMSLLEDGQHYRWATVRSYHMAWFQHLEQA